MHVLYLTPNEYEDITGIPIRKGKNITEAYPEHSHSFYELLFVSNGTGTHCINGKSHLLESGSFVFIRPNDIHSYKALNLDFEIFTLGFSENELLHTLQYLDIPLSKIISPTVPAHYILHGNAKTFVEYQLNFMLTKNTKKERQTLFRVFLPIALYLLQNLEVESYEKDEFPKWLDILDKEMSKRENYIIGLPRMLELCMYSQEHLNRSFKRYLKTTPTEYINSKRLDYASELLLEKNYTATDVCYITGFNNLSYFYSVFKKKYHCTPNQFLKQQR